MVVSEVLGVSVDARPTWASAPLATPKVIPGHRLRLGPSTVPVSRRPSMFHADATGGRAVTGTLRDGMETLGAEFGYTLPAHRVREIARLAMRHGWDIDGARREFSAALERSPESIGGALARRERAHLAN